MGRRKTTDEFITEAKARHGGKYGHDKTIYTGAGDKVIITCLTHGDFEQIASDHLRGHGCPKCAIESQADAQRSNTEEFIKKATSENVHGDKYEYGDVIYIGSNKKVEITCLTHGNFFQTPNAHLQGAGCPKCAGNLLKTNDEFIADSNKVHGHKYGHGDVIYIVAHAKVEITCPTHGNFFQTPNSHLDGQGCPKCKNSKGEQLVNNTLTEMNLNFDEQFKYENCKNKRKLPFDFCVKINDEKVFLIEYQGEQHYKPVKWHKKMSDEKAEEILLGIQARDEIKRVYARENNIPLLIISYKQKDIIDELLANFIYDILWLKKQM